MPYASVEDIPDNIETGRLDFRRANLLMRQVISTTRLALNHRYNFAPTYEDELRQYLKNQLFMYETIHDSLHVLIK